MALLPCVELEPRTPATAAVVWLHGLGADGHDFEPIVPELGLPDTLAVRFVFPHAPSIPVTINNGYRMPAWYDMLDMDLSRRADRAGLLASAARVAALLDRERERGIASERIVLAGFSQGGAVGLQLALTYPHRLAGLLALSTYFATGADVVPAAANRDLPIEVHHGLFDPLVPELMGRLTVDRLRDLGYDPTYRTYPMEHAVCAEQIADIGRWLIARLS
ncbi:MAG TPA: carboxylesterase [Gammaproteobacteria bacterium]|nr:carboxylesterase [Gammaproteobacteria bacterium]